MAGFDAMTQMNRDHTAREMQRMKVRAPVILLTSIIAGSGDPRRDRSGRGSRRKLGNAVAVVGVILAILLNTGCSSSPSGTARWSCASASSAPSKGRGSSCIVPVMDSVVRVIDMRVRTATFYSEAMLTRDTVPVNIDAIAFWKQD